MTDDRNEPARLGYELGAENEQEAAEFEDVAAGLGLAADPVEPPAELKAALFAKLASTPQSSPVAEPSHAPTPEAAAPAAPAPTVTPAEARARRRWFQRPGAIAITVAAAIALFFGGAFFGGSLTGTPLFQDQQALGLAKINAAHDLHRRSENAVGGGTVTLVWSKKLGSSALIATGLPALPITKTYELWYMRDGKAIPAGTMRPDSGASWRVLNGVMMPGDTVGMTVEPIGGSQQPTTKPIVAIRS